MRGLSSILSLIRNEFNKFDNTHPRMLDSIYHSMLKLFCNSIFLCDYVSMMSNTIQICVILL